MNAQGPVTDPIDSMFILMDADTNTPVVCDREQWDSIVSNSAVGDRLTVVNPVSKEKQNTVWAKAGNYQETLRNIQDNPQKTREILKVDGRTSGVEQDDEGLFHWTSRGCSRLRKIHANMFE